MVIGLIAAALACLAYGVSSVLQAYGAHRSAADHLDDSGSFVTPTGAPTIRSTLAAAMTAAFIVGIALDAAGFAGSAVSARLVPLFLGQTIVSANLIVTAILGVWVLHVQLQPREWGAIAVVLVSLTALGGAGGATGSTRPGASFHWVLLVAACTALLFGVLAVRRLGSRGSVAAGLVAGVMFGSLAIGVRVMDGLVPFSALHVVADPAAWAVVVAGAGGFYLHTVALQLGSVNGATAALVVGETVLPGIVGVLALGDRSRDGFGWLAVLGFVFAVLGAVAVASFAKATADGGTAADTRR